MLNLPALAGLLEKIMLLVIDLGGKPETAAVFEALIKFFGGVA